jgi:hypothetical protein
MNYEVNKTNKGNYGWLDLQRMNLPFTTISRFVSGSGSGSTERNTNIRAGVRQASEAENVAST